MEGWAIFLIIVGILIVLGLGIGITIWLVRRNKKPPPPPSGGGGGGGGSTGPNQPITPNVCPPGNTGATGTINGEFSLIPAGNTGLAMTIDDVSSTSDAQVIPSSDPNKIYAWSSGNTIASGATITNTLKFGASVDAKFNCNEGVLLVSVPKSDTTDSIYPSYVGKIGTLQFEDTTTISSWIYTPPGSSPASGPDFSSTFCLSPLTSSQYCLFFSTDFNSIIPKRFDPSDINFRWVLGNPKPLLG